MRIRLASARPRSQRRLPRPPPRPRLGRRELAAGEFWRRDTRLRRGRGGIPRSSPQPSALRTCVSRAASAGSRRRRATRARADLGAAGRGGPRRRSRLRAGSVPSLRGIARDYRRSPRDPRRPRRARRTPDSPRAARTGRGAFCHSCPVPSNRASGTFSSNTASPRTGSASSAKFVQPLRWHCVGWYQAAARGAAPWPVS
mmetsp:Transcript_31519/g.97292  ORF Transcript_31519/g.97292 Transcript_31519/m.97292 type:complete len:200 (-) Transcript_31519:550-1149(-)